MSSIGEVRGAGVVAIVVVEPYPDDAGVAADGVGVLDECDDIASDTIAAMMINVRAVSATGFVHNRIDRLSLMSCPHPANSFLR